MDNWVRVDLNKISYLCSLLFAHMFVFSLNLSFRYALEMDIGIFNASLKHVPIVYIVTDVMRLYHNKWITWKIYTVTFEIIFLKKHMYVLDSDS
jgi:hypothetical protein